MSLNTELGAKATTDTHEFLLARSIIPLDIRQILVSLFWSWENWYGEIKELTWGEEVRNSRIDTRYLLLPGSEFSSLFYTVKPERASDTQVLQEQSLRPETPFVSNPFD